MKGLNRFLKVAKPSHSSQAGTTIAIMSKPSRRNESASACPNTLCGVACCLFVCATIAFIAHLFISTHSVQAPRLWITAVVATNGNQATIMADTRRMEFWTPSAKTKDYLSKEGGKIADNDKWQVIPSDAAVLQFGGILHSNANVLG